MPKPAVRLGRSFEQQINSLLVGGLSEVELAPAVTPEPAVREQYDVARRVQLPTLVQFALSDLVNELLGLAEPDSAAVQQLGRLARVGMRSQSSQEVIRRRLDAQRAELEAKEDEYRKLFMRLEDEQLDHAETAGELDDATRMIRHLRDVMVRSGSPDAAWSEPTAVLDRVPDSFGDLVAQMSELRYIEFTGDKEPALSLDDQDPVGTWARKAWNALLALEDYAESSCIGQCDRDVHGYLQNPLEGCRGYSVNKHARDESPDVHKNPTFRAARVLPVPVEVAADGIVFMGAHFKITKARMTNTPRMHYYDDTARTGKVYIGYLGRHLPTKQTN